MRTFRPIDEALSYGYNDTPLLLSPVGESEDSFIDDLSSRREIPSASFRQPAEHAKPSDYRNLYRTKSPAQSVSRLEAHQVRFIDAANDLVWFIGFDNLDMCGLIRIQLAGQRTAS